MYNWMFIFVTQFGSHREFVCVRKYVLSDLVRTERSRVAAYLGYCSYINRKFVASGTRTYCCAILRLLQKVLMKLGVRCCDITADRSKPGAIRAQFLLTYAHSNMMDLHG